MFSEKDRQVPMRISHKLEPPHIRDQRLARLRREGNNTTRYVGNCYPIESDGQETYPNRFTTYVNELHTGDNNVYLQEAQKVSLDCIPALKAVGRVVEALVILILKLFIGTVHGALYVLELINKSLDGRGNGWDK